MSKASILLADSLIVVTLFISYAVIAARFETVDQTWLVRRR
jgi:hypothetical protein